MECSMKLQEEDDRGNLFRGFDSATEMCGSQIKAVETAYE